VAYYAEKLNLDKVPKKMLPQRLSKKQVDYSKIDLSDSD